MNAQVQKLIAEAFDLPASSIREDSGPETIEAWDSVGHLNLVQELERTFSLRLTVDEILSIRSARDVQNVLLRRNRLASD